MIRFPILQHFIVTLNLWERKIEREKPILFRETKQKKNKRKDTLISVREIFFTFYWHFLFSLLKFFSCDYHIFKIKIFITKEHLKKNSYAHIFTLTGFKTWCTDWTNFSPLFFLLHLKVSFHFNCNFFSI